MPAPLTAYNLSKLSEELRPKPRPEPEVEGYSLPVDMDRPPVNVPTLRAVRRGFLPTLWAVVVSWADIAATGLLAWASPAYPRLQEVWDGIQGVGRLARRSFGRAFGQELPEILTLFAKDIGRGIGEFLVGALRIVFSIGAFLFNFFEWFGGLILFDVSGVVFLAAKGLWRFTRAALRLVIPTRDGIFNLFVGLILGVIRLVRVTYAALARVVRERSLWPRSTMIYD
ncbi:uncharacterized protein LOC62_05G007145 [Vanrija pseudolonga]|uniref:Uncharacterized protein n=1 Tax=Vanrija pseudolonga TaxID=143232 RepID=A0AAF1BMP2_9TREE|nr:hypothetical protein LOC62_05G007145 [Vanrija pseudolonga]